MKIFIGLTDISSQISEFAKGFNSLGIDTLTAVYDNSSIIVDGQYDFILHNIVPTHWKQAHSLGTRIKRRLLYDGYRKLVWQKALNECDVFMFMWSSFRPDFSDFPELKKRNKKIVIWPVGSEVRWQPAMEQDYTNYNLPLIEYSKHNQYDKSLDDKLRFLRMAERYSDLTFGAPNGFQLALKPYPQTFVPIDLSIYVENCYQRESDPIILHAPSHEDVKGTKYILPVVKRLREEGFRFEFKLLRNIPFKEIIKIYSESDILIGQLLIPGGGKQEREALASGMVVLSSIIRQYPENIPIDCPIIDVGPETLYQELKRILSDYPMRVRLAKKGRPYVEKYHDTEIICQKIIESLSSEKPTYDIHPNFFREKFIPNSEEEVKILNKWTRFVSGTGWYKEYVIPGERDGLIF